MRSIASESELGSRWEVARPVGSNMPGVELGGFRDRVGGEVEVIAVALPAFTVAVGCGNVELTIEDDARRRVINGFVGGISPGMHRVRGTQVEGVKARLSPVLAYSVLGVPPADLSATVVGLDDLWGRAGDRLCEQMAETELWAERFALMTAFLLQQSSERIPDAEVSACWHRILAGQGQVTVAELAAFSGWSRKRLWARFTAQIGVTPKHATRVVRFRRAFDMLVAGKSASEAAVACGYSDQSHMHREVSTFARMTPGVLAKP